MELYFAPLEGITGYVYRNVHARHFSGIDKYFAPFISTSSHGFQKRKEVRDILSENNEQMHLVPQLLSNCAQDFIDYGRKIYELGYSEINLNLGCPSRTVVSKGKGAGFLAEPEALDQFLDQVFSQLKGKISIKTRIGKDDPEEFFGLMEIYNKYPVSELIIHPRTQTDYYKNKPNLKVFGEAVRHSQHPVCYNGDICTKEEFDNLTERFPNLQAVMIGRGFLKNPALAQEIVTGEHLKITVLKQYHDELYQQYKELFSGDKPVLFKMKELWLYLIEYFPEYEKYGKRLKKTQRLCDYEGIAAELFSRLLQS